MPERNWNGRKGRSRCRRGCLKQYKDSWFGGALAIAGAFLLWKREENDDIINNISDWMMIKMLYGVEVNECRIKLILLKKN